jgi:hypothetical protein
MFNLEKLKESLKINPSNKIFSNIEIQNLKSNLNSTKKILYQGKKQNAVKPKVVKQVYSQIPDDVQVPVVFMTKKQYLKQYIKNQEVKNNVNFTKREELQYIKNELKGMRPIVSRFTTYQNPYMQPRVVFFTDKKINKKDFEKNVYHEFGHELFEKNVGQRVVWNTLINPKNSPTIYGKTDRDEDFAESFTLFKQGKLQDRKRLSFFRSISPDKYSENAIPIADARYITLYHGTQERFLPGILSKGLLPPTYTGLSDTPKDDIYSDRNKVFLTPSENTAIIHSRGGSEVLREKKRREMISLGLPVSGDISGMVFPRTVEQDRKTKTVKDYPPGEKPVVVQVKVPKQLFEEKIVRDMADEKIKFITENNKNFAIMGFSQMKYPLKSIYQLTTNLVTPDFIQKVYKDEDYDKFEKRNLRRFSDPSQVTETYREDINFTRVGQKPEVKEQANEAFVQTFSNEPEVTYTTGAQPAVDNVTKNLCKVVYKKGGK